MTHKRLQQFFAGAVDEMRGAYEKSKDAPDACKGSLRERGVRRAIEYSLPGIVKLYDGEIIDPCGGQSGQLDGILVHASGSALATEERDGRVVLAEGALAVLESKSSLPGQWQQVQTTWDKVRILRRWRTPRLGDDPAQSAIPFYVIGYVGWKEAQTLQDNTLRLFQSFGAENPTGVTVVQLSPPGIGRATPGEPPVASILSEENRWQALAMLWGLLTGLALYRRHVEIDWNGYLNPLE